MLQQIYLLILVLFFFAPQVFNNHYLQVTIDDLRPEPSNISMLCHADSLGILPIQWCLKNGVNLTPPKGLYSFSVIFGFTLKGVCLLLIAFRTVVVVAAEHQLKYLKPE